MSSLVREHRFEELTVTDTLGTTEAIPFADMAGLAIRRPSGSSIATVTWYGSEDGVTYAALYDSDGSAVTTAFAGDYIVEVNGAVFPCKYLKPVGDVSGAVLFRERVRRVLMHAILEEFSTALGELTTVVGDWDASSGPVRLWNGAEVKVLSSHVEDAADKLCGVVENPASNELPSTIQHTVLAADKFCDAWKEWKLQTQAEPITTPPYGTDAVWSTWRDLCAARNPRVFSTLESMLELEKQGVSMRQRAQCYGFFRATDGEPDVRRANEETERQRRDGYDPAEFQTPADRDREEQLTADWAARCKHVQSVAESKDDTPSQQPTEDVHDLVVLPYITVDQIKRMLPGVTDAEINEACAIHKVKLNGQQFVTSSKPAGLHEQMKMAEETLQEEETQRTKMSEADRHAEIEDIEDRVQALSEDGLKPGEISDILAESGIQMAATRVGRMLANIARKATA